MDTEKDNISNQEELEALINDAVKTVRDQAMFQGARMICANCVQIIDKHLGKAGKVTMNDYKRCFNELYNFVSIPLNKLEVTQQSDSEGTDDA